VNRSAIKTRDLPRHFSSVLFAPEDLALVRGEPSGRRRFLDELLVLRTPRLSGVMADYERVLRQRNTLLKTARASAARGDQLATLEIWDDRLVALGSEILAARSVLVAELLPEISSAYLAIAGEDHHATIAGQLSIDASGDEPILSTKVLLTRDVAVRFREALTRVRRAELDRAITLVGPHRDDLLLELNGMTARGHASHGESWSFALALKLASATVLRRESSSGDPVLILDDVFAELDQSRRARLAAAIADFEQVLITAAVYEDVPSELTTTTIRIVQGRIEGA
jgi:DNA replication and repair protein RecF